MGLSPSFPLPSIPFPTLQSKSLYIFFIFQQISTFSFFFFLSLILSIKQMKFTKFNFILSSMKQKLLLNILFLPFNCLHFFSFLPFHFLLPCYKTQFLIFFVQFLLFFQKIFYKLI